MAAAFFYPPMTEEIWAAVNKGLTNLYIQSLATIGTDIFAGTNGGGVFLSIDSGGSWTAIDSGLTSTVINSLTISGGDILAGTNGGVWKCALANILGIENISVNNRINIYPDPATTQLTIQTTMFHNVVAVSIMNVLGQEAASPPAPLQRRGEDAVIDVSGLSAGIYFLQLKSENRSIAKMFIKE
jgi:hypothetical protein